MPSPLPQRGDAPGRDDDLAGSIARYGLFQPLTVRMRSGRCELISGSRRLNAAKAAGLFSVPCRVADASLEQAYIASLSQNLHFLPLEPEEERGAIRRLSELFGMGIDEASRRLCLPRERIAAAMYEGLGGKFIMKDLRVFVNTIEHALDLMRKSGAEADMEKREGDDGITLTIHINK